MVGKVLEYEAKSIKREGFKEGMELGIKVFVGVLRKLGFSEQAIQAEIQEVYQLSPEESEMYVKLWFCQGRS